LSLQLPSRLFWRAVLAGAFGALAVLAFAPFHIWPLAIVSLGFLFALWLTATNKKQAALLGFCWGLGLFCTGVSWIYISLHDFGGMPAPLAALAVLLFSSMLALLPTLAGVLAQSLRRGASSALTLLLIMPASFVAMEYLRISILTGFPWLIMGYTQTPGALLGAPLVGFAPVLGVFAISWLLAFTAGACVLMLQSLQVQAPRARRTPVLVALLAVFGGGWALQWISWTSPVGAPLSAALVQGNIEQDLKWREDQHENTRKIYLDLVLKSKAKLIILPETAIPQFDFQVPPEYFDQLKAIAVRNGGDLVLGMPTYAMPPPGESPKALFNSAVSLGISPAQTYSKSHLVAFGEFIPPLFSWVYQWLNIPMSGFTPGPETQPSMRLSGHRVAINICYEDTFGHEIAASLPDAALLVNISNMAWFGRPLAGEQHAQFSQMRAMETGRWMLRSTNTGLTAAINEQGKIVKALPQYERGTVEVEAQPREGMTPYVRWKDAPVLASLFIAFCVALWCRQRKR
jgi:apolipoprotein N-acyltransferase